MSGTNADVTATAARTGETPAFHPRHFTRRGHGAEFDMEVDWILSHVPVGTRVIADLGCGNGALLRCLRGRLVIGLDASVQGLLESQNDIGTRPSLCADARVLPLADGSVDVLTAQHVIEHCMGFESLFRGWFRVLAPGGALLILTPNAVYCDHGTFYDPTHTHIFTPDEMARLLRRAGFEVTDLRTLGLPILRCYRAVPGGWRLRKWIIGQAQRLSKLPGCRWKGQTLCCAARKPLAT